MKYIRIAISVGIILCVIAYNYTGDRDLGHVCAGCALSFAVIWLRDEFIPPKGGTPSGEAL